MLPSGTAERYPALTRDIAEVEELVSGPFAESDGAARVHQNRFRRQQVVILLGTALVSGLGGLQAVFPDQRWPGILLVVLGLALSAVGTAARELGELEAFLAERVKAERLRSTYFRYVSRTGRYAGDDRRSVLRRSVLAIRNGEEPS